VFCDEVRLLLDQLHPKVKVKRPRNSRYDLKFIHHAEKMEEMVLAFGEALQCCEKVLRHFFLSGFLNLYKIIDIEYNREFY